MIRLIWRKRKTMSKKRNQLKKTKANKIIKKSMSGKAAFKQAKRQEGLSPSEITLLWTHLPLESKRMWIRMGRGSNDSTKMN